jgi:hypothetical protein
LIEEPIRRSHRVAALQTTQAAASVQEESPAPSPSRSPSPLDLENFGPDPRRRSPIPSHLSFLPDVDDNALAPSIGDFDKEFFDSQEACDGIRRESSCDALSEDDFDDADENMDPAMSLEDVLSWPPEL